MFHINPLSLRFVVVVDRRLVFFFLRLHVPFLCCFCCFFSSFPCLCNPFSWCGLIDWEVKFGVYVVFVLMDLVYIFSSFNRFRFYLFWRLFLSFEGFVWDILISFWSILVLDFDFLCCWKALFWVCVFLCLFVFIRCWLALFLFCMCCGIFLGFCCFFFFMHACCFCWVMVHVWWWWWKSWQWYSSLSINCLFKCLKECTYISEPLLCENFIYCLFKF